MNRLERCFSDNGGFNCCLPNAMLMGQTSIVFLVHHTISYDQMLKYSNSVDLF